MATPSQRRNGLARHGAAAVPVLLAALTGCHHTTHTAYRAPTPPTYTRNGTYASRGSAAPRPVRPPVIAASPEQLRGRPSLVETGLASWYGTQYNSRHAADGSVYDENALTAAHRTLPLGTLVRVTNLATNQQVVARITDRGPFVRGRVLDLSVGAAKAAGVYRMGVAKVKIEAFLPSAASAGGMWAVQTGAFRTQQDALDLKNALVSRYRAAKVIEFAGPTGYWVRIDPPGRDHTQAAAIQEWIGKPDDHAEAYLVRLD